MKTPGISFYTVLVLLLLGIISCKSKVDTELTVEISKKEGLIYFADNPQDSMLISTLAIVDSITMSEKGDYFDVFVEVWHQKFGDEKMYNHFKKAWLLEHEMNGYRSLEHSPEIQVLKGCFEVIQKEALDVISKRLSEAGAKKVTVAKTEKNDVFVITMTNAPAKEIIQKLATTHGVFGIYETYNLIDVFQCFDAANKKLIENLGQFNDSQLIVGPVFELLAPSVLEGSEQSWKIAPGPVAGQCLNTDTARLIGLLKDAETEFPKELLFMWSAGASNISNEMSDLFMIKTYRGNSSMDNSHISYACVGSALKNNSTELKLEMNEEGKSLLRKLTLENTGLFLAVVIDNKVYNASSVNERNESGKFIFPVKLNSDQATELSYILSAGPILPNVHVVSIK
ncbi:MAG: hypothetical protein KBB11_02305 [Bacteroidales bacterium]|nr:hypothetical protein [Bacteroidales bacterium]HOY39190.1 hypothetical protein [Bacteroidales bacterium]HQP03322.1 hypothetical protein [Bacteroidales bacterium]